MSERRDRFLKLESPRPLSSPDARDGAQAEPPAVPQSHPIVLPEKLQAERRAQLESGLALDLHSDDEQPFVRCGRCETDAPRDATACQTCGAALTTPEQRAFNQALWAARRAELAREKLAMAEHSHPPMDETASQEARQRALGVALAAEVKERESARLAWMDDPRRSLHGAFVDRSPGMRWLAGISDPSLRLSCTLGCFGLAGACGWELFFRPQQFHPFALGGLLALAILFAPRRGSPDLDE